MARKILLTALIFAGAAQSVSSLIYGQVVAPSTWANNITIDAIVGPPPSSAFDDWDAIPLAVSDPADNPSALNLIDIADVKIANDSDFIYIYASGHRMRTNGLYLAFDTDQDVATGFNIFGLSLVGSEIGYVNDFVFDQRTPGVFNDNKPDAGGSCCTGGPLDLNNGGAAMNPTWDVESEEREWGIPLDAMWSVNEPFGPTFPNPTFNFILWTDQGLTDVTEVITYTLATPPPGAPGDFDGDEDVDGADFIEWQQGVGGEFDASDLVDWRANFGMQPPPVAAIPEPAGAALIALGMIGVARRRRRGA
jgi:MYXO-CTERM domain-containing protein